MTEDDEGEGGASCGGGLVGCDGCGGLCGLGM
jgi:hypothetical protein